MNAGRPDGREEEARRSLSRLSQEADGSSMASPGRDGQADDWIETVGTRIGRILGPLLLFLCAAWLLFHLSRGG